jgi:hypothetical protein
MRETVRSLRIYFIVVAVAGGAVNLTALFGSAQILGTLIAMIGVGIASAYFYVGLSLRRLLVRSPGQITAVLIAGGAFLLLLVLLNVLTGMEKGFLVRAIIGLLITWYLLTNVRRLVAESSPPAPPGPAGSHGT